MNTHVRITSVELEAADANRVTGLEQHETQSYWLGIAVLGTGGGITLFWIAFIIWLLGYIFGYF